MGPPGGGRNSITDRMTRHLNVISIDNFSQETITKIFQSIVDWQYSTGYDAGIQRASEMLCVYNAIYLNKNR